MASFTQEDDAPAAGVRQTYPDYAKDEEIFASFVQQHTILIENNSDHDDDMPHRYHHHATGGGGGRRIPCYLGHLQRIKDRQYYDDTSHDFIIEVPLSELVEWDAGKGADLATRASHNTLRYHEIFCRVLDAALAGLAQQQVPNNNNNNPAAAAVIRDVGDILQEQRMAAHEAAQQQRQENTNDAGIHGGTGNMDEGEQQQQAVNLPHGAVEAFPPLLNRRYQLRILPMGRNGMFPPFDRQYRAARTATTSNSKGPLQGVSLRDVRSNAMGHLVTITGMVVRSSDVKPACVVATYACDACGSEVYQVVQNQREFMPPRTCVSPMCQNTKKNQQSLQLETKLSKFVKFQELKLQELPNQVPMGHIPRSMSVHCRGELTRLASPGDVITIDGIFLPQRIAESGYRALKGGLISTTFLESQNIVVHKKSYDESLIDSLSEEESAQLEEEIVTVAMGEDPIGKLSSSIAPEIFGHEDIKRALLLQLVGGCTRALPDGMKIRGDINICLMGDPGVAKSQLLKHVASIAPRGVYTTGKGSSGVGLTAAVTKDITTGEMALEGGALVLADRGICCIDEFDKMQETDRTAIHEVMEQQTVSIAKAGIVATLNARAAVLAAANPLYGRYNRSKSLSENVNLPNSLLSRFDLLFLILDVADVDRDMALARHVTFVHQNEGLNLTRGDGNDSDEDLETADNDVVSPKVLREYIARARRHQPFMPPDVAPYVVEAYVSLRSEDRSGPRRSKQSDQTVMTARQLLSILRLSQALARLRFSDLVAREDVDEAIRLTHMSKSSLVDEGEYGDGRSRGRGEDVMSRIYNIIKDFATVSHTDVVEIQLAEAMILRKGFTSQQLQSCLEEYESLNVLHVNQTRTHITFQ